MTFDYEELVTGVAPAGPTPWFTVDFEDRNDNGTLQTGVVSLTFNALNLRDRESIDNVYFNLNPELDPAKLIFTAIDVAAVDGKYFILRDRDAVKSPAFGVVGNFDIEVDFPPAYDTRGKQNRFMDDESVVFHVSYDDAVRKLVASDFGSETTLGYATAAHIQSTGTDGRLSGTVTVGDDDGGGTVLTPVPEPASSLSLAILLTSGVAFRRRRL